MRRSGALAVWLLLAPMVAGAAGSFHGFDVSDLAIPRGDLLPGGPPRDGIPALTDPAFLASGEASYLKDSDRILGVELNGVAKAYPIRILNWHEIVNDRFADTAVAVTYCPLCYTGMAFRAEMDGRRNLFGVSGLLYNSDVVLYDRATESLWSQLLGQAISGPKRGQRLEAVPVTNTTWAAWRARHPESLVLSFATGYRRDYARDPYGAYAESRDLIFPVRFRSQGFHPKQPVLGIVIDGVAKAYPLSELARAGAQVADDVDGRTVEVRLDEQHETAEIFNAQGERLPGVIAYWFAWYTFHPDTRVFRANRR